MATITSVDLYLGLVSAKSGFNIVVEIHALGSYANDPDVGSLLGSKAIDVDNIPLLSGPGPNWVTFTFDTPITVSSNNFAGIVFDSLGSNYDSDFIRHYHAQDYDYYTSGAKAGTERCYIDHSGNWVDQGAGLCLCYRINGTDITQNVADNPSASYEMLGGRQHGFRAYVDGGSAPSKATSPAPTNSATGVSLNQATLTWTEGVGADYENVYFGPSGNVALQEIVNITQSWALADASPAVLPLSYNTTYQWRIDSVNNYGTATGDTWSFTTLSFTPPTITYFYPTTGQYYRLLIQSDGTYGDPPGVGVENTDYVYLAAGYEHNAIATTRKLIAAAENRIWYENI